MIYNKSEHPIEVKKISIRLWSLRDEIEAAIGRRMKECEAAGVPLYIDDIKSFYNLSLKTPLNEPNNLLVLPTKVDENEMAKAMESMSAEGGDDDNEMARLMESMKEEENAAAAAAAAPVEAAPVEAAPVEAAPAVAEEAASPEAAGVIAAEMGTEVTTASVDGEATIPPVESKTFNQAEQILAEQTKQGLETDKPNPILMRPYQRQAPDLDKISYGFTLLSDIHMANILIFTKDKFLHGQSVVMEFLIPQNFIMTANVTYCHYFALRSRIISSTRPDYRLQCHFSFALTGERDTLRKFLKSIEPNLDPKKKRKEAEDDSLGI